MAAEDPGGQRASGGEVVVAPGEDRDRHIEPRHHEDPLLAVADRSARLDQPGRSWIAVVPPEVTIAELSGRIGSGAGPKAEVPAGRALDPLSRDDLLAVPLPAVQKQRAELGQVAGAEPEAGSG